MLIRVLSLHQILPFLSECTLLDLVRVIKNVYFNITR
jgi:hypothetical protein